MGFSSIVGFLRLSIVVTFAVMAMVFSVLLYQIEDSAHKQFVERSYASMDRSVSRYQEWRESHFSVLRQLTSDPYIIQKTSELLAVKMVPDTLKGSDALKALREYMGPKLLDGGYLGMFIISPDGYNYGSMRDSNLAYINITKIQMPDLFEKARSGESVMTPPILSDVALKYSELTQSTMFMVSPIKNAKGDIIALLGVRLDPYADFSLLFANNAHGETGELYIVNRRGYFLSKGRFLDKLVENDQVQEENQAILTIKALSLSSSEITRHTYHDNFYDGATRERASDLGPESEIIHQYINYYGEEVFGFWRWSGEHNFALVSEVAVAELHADQKIILTISYVFAAVVAVLLLLIFAATYRLKIKFRDKHLSFVKQMAEGEGYLAALRDAIIVVNQFGIIEYINEIACDLFEVESADVLQTHILSFLKGSDEYVHLMPEFRPLHQVYNHGDDFHVGYFLFEGDSKRADKKLSYVATVLKSQSQHMGAFLQIRDVSVVSNRLDQQRLAEKNNIRLLTKQRELMKDVILEAQKPMMELSSYMKLIHSSSGNLPDALKQYIQLSVRSVRELSKMSEDLVLITDHFKIDEGNNQQEVNISLILEMLHQKYSLEFANHGYEFYISESIKEAPNVRANHDKLRHVLEQIIRRTIKFNYHNGSLMVRCMVLENDLMKIDILESPGDYTEKDGPGEDDIDKERTFDYTMAISMQVLEYIVGAIGGRFGYKEVLGSYNSYWIELPLAIKGSDNNQLPETTTNLIYSGNDNESGVDAKKAIHALDEEDETTETASKSVK